MLRPLVSPGCPGAVRPLIVEQELDAALDGGGNFWGSGGVIGAGLGPVVASCERSQGDRAAGGRFRTRQRNRRQGTASKTRADQ